MTYGIHLRHTLLIHAVQLFRMDDIPVHCVPEIRCVHAVMVEDGLVENRQRIQIATWCRRRLATVGWNLQSARFGNVQISDYSRHFFLRNRRAFCTTRQQKKQ